MAPDRPRRAADLLVDCSRPRAASTSFSVPGEETMDILDALSRHEAVRHITTRHEQGAAFMADVHGRLTGRAAIAMATPRPGRDEPSDGHRRRVPRPRPMVAITGQAASGKLHKEAHQVVDVVRMFEPVTKWNIRVERIRAIPRSFARRSASRCSRSPARPTSSCPKTSPRPTSRRGTAADRLCRSPRTRLLPRADRRGHRARGPPDRRVRAARSSCRQRRPPTRSRSRVEGPRPGPARPGCRDLHGQGRHRRSFAPVAHGRRSAGARPRALRLRSRRPRHLRRL